MSRSYLPTDSRDTYSEFEVVNAVQFIPMGQEKLENFRLETEKDDTLQVLKTTILKGRPEDKSKVLPRVTPYYSVSDELSCYDGLVFRGERLVAPQGPGTDIKRELHASQGGVEVCLRRARESVYWPSMNSELRHSISTWEPCRLFGISHGKETLMNHEVPQRT